MQKRATVFVKRAWMVRTVSESNALEMVVEMVCDWLEKSLFYLHMSSSGVEPNESGVW